MLCHLQICHADAVQDRGYLIVGVSRRTLENFIVECVHSTPQQIINNRIVVEIKRLLLSTDYKLSYIAQIMGMDPSNLSKFFKKNVGVSPIDFREAQGKTEN